MTFVHSLMDDKPACLQPRRCRQEMLTGRRPQFLRRTLRVRNLRAIKTIGTKPLAGYEVFCGNADPDPLEVRLAMR